MCSDYIYVHIHINKKKKALEANSFGEQKVYGWVISYLQVNHGRISRGLILQVKKLV